MIEYRRNAASLISLKVRPNVYFQHVIPTSRCNRNFDFD